MIAQAKVQAQTVHRQLTVANLSPDQKEAHDGILIWLNRGTATKRTLTFSGTAGTGKSTVVAILAHELLKRGACAFVAYTGKASSVLKRKLAESGIQTVNRVVQKSLLGGAPAFEPRPYCGTIHGLIYRPCDVCMIETAYEHHHGPLCRDEPEQDETSGVSIVTPSVTAPPWIDPGKCLACDPPPPVKREGPCSRCQDERYLRREQLDRRYSLIIADEASMIDDTMLTALLSYGVPILAVGDHGQLPPVKGAGALMRAPDLKLEKIHRQAEGNPIIALSARIRATGDIDDRLEDGDAFTIMSRRDLPNWIESRWTLARLAADPHSPEGAMGSVLVSWTNKMRVNLNYDVRAALGYEGPPAKGEVLICLKNKAPIYNGMRGVLMADAVRAGDAGGRAPKWKASIDFVEDGQNVTNILLSEHQFFAEKTLEYEAVREMGVSMAQLGELYDMGYALTCHKMQGSQAPEVCVVVEPGLMRMSKEDRTRWLYTSCTRASTRLCLAR